MWEFVQNCRSPSGPGLSICSSVVAFRFFFELFNVGVSSYSECVYWVFEFCPETPTTFWFNKLKTRCCNLGFAVAIDGGWTYLLWKNAEIYPKLSCVGLVMFLKVCNASPLKREWHQLSLSSSVSWLWILRFVWETSSNSSIFSAFPANLGVILLSDFVSLKTLLVLLLKLAGLMIIDKNWRANNLVPFNCRMCVFPMDLRFTRRACFLLLVWRRFRGAVRNHFFNSCPCGKSRSGWNLVRTGTERQPLQDDDHSGNDPDLYACSLYLNSRMSPTRIRSEIELAGSDESHWTRKKCLKCNLLS